MIFKVCIFFSLTIAKHCVTNKDIEISFPDPTDNRNGNKKVGLIHAYFVFSFNNVENDEMIHLKNGETLKVKRGC